MKSSEHDRGNKLGWTLLLLTSTRHRRFVEDILAVTALPVGARWRFRYLEKYVDPSIFVVANSPVAKGLSALVGVVGFEDASEAEQANPINGRYIELLRSATVLSIKKEGQLIVIDFELGPFASTEQELHLSFNADTAAHLPHRSPNNSPQGWFCSVGPELKGIKYSAQVDDWERAAGIALNRTPPDIVPFVFGVFPSIARRKCSINKGTLTIQAAKRGTIEIHTLSRPGISPDIYTAAIGEIKLGITHPAMSFVSSSTVRIDTHRNVKAIVIQSLPAFRETVGHLSVLASGFEKPNGARDGKPQEDTKEPSKENNESPDRSSKRPAFVRLDLALSSGGRSTMFFCLLAACVVVLSSFKLEHTVLERYEWIKILAIALLTAIGLRRGLSLKG